MDRLDQYRTIIQQVLHEYPQLSRQIRAEHPDDPNCPAEAIAYNSNNLDKFWTSE